MRYLAGIQPSGPLHIGNWFGALRPHLARQQQHECTFFLADLHALTSSVDGHELRRRTHALALDLLALGLDPERSLLFRQSDVPQVTELCWILGTVTGVGLLERCHAYKDKVARGLPRSLGLFAYPVLMAADILLLRPDRVPVGPDQLQHLEVARDIVHAFHRRYGAVFAPPLAEIEPDQRLVPGLDGRKMSKSHGNVVPVFADDAALRRAVASIVTDSSPLAAPKDPEANPIHALYRLVAGDAAGDELAAQLRAGGLGYGEAKQRLLAALSTRLQPYRARRSALAAEPGEVERVLVHGAARARDAAERTMAEVRRAVGLR